MKPFEIVFQGLTSRHHVDVFGDLCAVPDLQRLLISVAFATSNGVSLLEESLSPHVKKTIAWIGVRNDVTSIQGLSALLPLVGSLFIVDTAIRQRIFHPKVYLSYSKVEARVGVGSANLTVGGLSRNIEASAAVCLDLRDENNANEIRTTEALLMGLAAEFPENVRKIQRQSQLETLLASGVIIDEALNVAPRPAATRGVGARNADAVKRMILFSGPLPRRSARPSKPVATRTAVGPFVFKRKIATVRPVGNELVWESKPLSRRDLNIPTGSNTSATGSMLFKKGEWDDIDQRQYFYDEVFDSLTWTSDPKKKTTKRSEADFELIIKNIDYGVHRLKLTHNGDEKSRSYKQNNSMTQVSWGDVKPYIAKEDLLERRLSLYRNSVDPTRFAIEID